MKALFVAAALALATPDAPPGPPPPPPPPAPAPAFPAPKLTAVTPDIKCDWGALTDVKPSLLVVKTDAGLFEVQLGSGSRFAGPDGKPLGSTANLRVGQNVRVYYRVENRVGGGAKAQEVDVY